MLSTTTMDRLALWRDLLAEQRASGLSVADWCSKEGVSSFTYYYWRKRVSSSSDVPASDRAARTAESLSSSREWLAVPMSGADVMDGSSVITLRVGHVSVEIASGFDRRLLGDVLSVLEARC